MLNFRIRLVHSIDIFFNDDMLKEGFTGTLYSIQYPMKSLSARQKEISGSYGCRKYRKCEEERAFSGTLTNKNG